MGDLGILSTKNDGSSRPQSVAESKLKHPGAIGSSFKIDDISHKSPNHFEIKEERHEEGGDIDTGDRQLRNSMSHLPPINTRTP